MPDQHHASDDRKISSLKQRADFLRLNKSKSKWIARTIIVQTAPRTHSQAADPHALQCGITVTKRVFKSAVKRNRIKRRLRALAQDILTQRADPTHDYVFIGRDTTLTAPFSDLKRDLVWCLKKMGRLDK